MARLTRPNGQPIPPLWAGGVLTAVVAAGIIGCTTGVRSAPPAAPSGKTLTGQAALGDWTTDAPGVRRLVTPAEMPASYETGSTDNGPKVVPRPQGANLKVPPGFEVQQIASGLNNPRAIITAPNGDLFIAESRANQIRVIRDADNDGKPEKVEVYAQDLTLPFGLAFYPPGPNPEFLYVGNTNSVIRFPYKNGDLHPAGASEMIVPDIPGFGQLRGGGHWTRDLQFSADGKKLWVSVGSFTNVGEGPREDRRAAILQYDPLGRNYKLFATGIRNPVGLALNPVNQQLWTSVNERDELGDHLVPDYITSVKEGGFYGWPWYYIGPNQDPRFPGKRPDLKDKVIVPDVLLQSHSASLDMDFYTGRQFPKAFRNDAFAAEHGSWNKARRTGYKIIRVPFKNGKATGEYEDFVTGFVTPDGNVWGRPVGVTVAKDGALIFTEDAANTVWRVSYRGK